ncbi:hypothetical protein LCGC14_0604210 [marine sediment metagenome]|uniref:Uncharacterized protein n=1 Tax=marine sediment metagenome TaxID=412755 RepID=A0A0F9REE5_9ZZZZ
MDTAIAKRGPDYVVCCEIPLIGRLERWLCSVRSKGIPPQKKAPLRRGLGSRRAVRDLFWDVAFNTLYIEIHTGQRTVIRCFTFSQKI